MIKKLKKHMLIVVVSIVASAACAGIVFAFYDIDALERRTNDEVAAFERKAVADASKECEAYKTSRIAQVEKEINDEIKRLQKECDDRVENEKNKLNGELKKLQEQMKAEIEAEEKKLLGGGQ